MRLNVELEQLGDLQKQTRGAKDECVTGGDCARIRQCFLRSLRP